MSEKKRDRESVCGRDWMRVGEKKTGLNKIRFVGYSV